jgi:hypothetical protein
LPQLPLKPATAINLGFAPSGQTLEQLHRELQQKLVIIVTAMSKTSSIFLVQDFNECNAAIEKINGVLILRYNPCFALLARWNIGNHADYCWLTHEVVHTNYAFYGYSLWDTLSNWGLEIKADSIAGSYLERLGIPLIYSLEFHKNFSNENGTLTHPPSQLRIAKTAEAYFIELANRWGAGLGSPLQKMALNEPVYVPEYIYSHMSVAVKLFFETGIPPSISLAMQAKSSAYGKSASPAWILSGDEGWYAYSKRLMAQSNIQLLVQNRNYNYLDWGKSVSGLVTDPNYARDLTQQIERLGLKALDTIVIEMAVALRRP